MCSGTSSHSKHREVTGNVHSSKADPFPHRAEVLHRVFHPSVQGCGAGTHGGIKGQGCDQGMPCTHSTARGYQQCQSNRLYLVSFEGRFLWLERSPSVRQEALQLGPSDVSLPVAFIVHCTRFLFASTGMRAKPVKGKQH